MSEGPSRFSALDRLARNVEIVRRDGLNALEQADVWSWFEHYSTWVQIHERFRVQEYIAAAKDGGFKAVRNLDPMAAIKFFTAFSSLKVSQDVSNNSEVDAAEVIQIILTIAQLVAAAV
jgi:hypothetical protein